MCACISNSGWSAALLCPAAEAAVWCEVGDRRQGSARRAGALQPGSQVKKPGTTTKMLRSNSLPCEEYREKDRKQENQEKKRQGSARRAGAFQPGRQEKNQVLQLRC